MLQKHKKPINNSPSKFIQESLQKYTADSNLPCLDIPSGFGRHSIYLSSLNYKVVSADYDIDVFVDQWHKIGIHNYGALILNANKPLPFKRDTFSMVVIVDFYSKILFESINEVLSQDGLLIYESYGGHGENWKQLPNKLEIRHALEQNFNFKLYIENVVGPTKDNVSLRMIARKK